MTLKSSLAIAFFACCVATNVWAADPLSYPEEVEQQPNFSWSGAYAGVQGGYGWGVSSLSTSKFLPDLKTDSFLWGVYAGYNQHVGNNVILGVEADVVSDRRAKITAVTLANTAYEGTSKLKWLGSARARIGFAVDCFLPYLAGGLAFGKTQDTTFNPTTNAIVSQNNDKRFTGWTVGTGADYAAMDDVVLRLEYRYTDFGNKKYSSGKDTYTEKLKGHDVRLGVAYKF